VRTSTKVSSEDRYLVLLKKNILIPEGARACAEHTENRRLTMEAIDRVAPYSVQQHQLDASDVQLLLTKAQMLYEQKKRFDFDHPSSVSDHEYQVLTSLSKEHFGDLIERISTSNIRNTTNRSIRTAIALLLCKLRLGLSNNLLALFFQLPDKRAVSRALQSARSALISEFVPFNLGFEDVSRGEVIDKHTTKIARLLMCNDDADTAAVVVDSTYVFIQVRSNCPEFLSPS
jgi:hypothetical protein